MRVNALRIIEAQHRHQHPLEFCHELPQRARRPPEETSVDWHQVIFKGLILKGIYGREMFETWYKMSSMLQSGLNIEPIITHHFNVNEFQPAFELMESGQSGKVILNWNQ